MTSTGPPRVDVNDPDANKPTAVEGAGLGAWAVVAVVLGWAYAPNFAGLARTWARDPNYSHGFLVVPIALLILARRHADPDRTPRAPWGWGWGALAAVLAARAVFQERGEEWRETATILPALACLALTYGGWSLLGRASPAIAFLGFMLPLPPRLDSVLSGPLQHLATAGSCSLLRLSGLWVMAEGHVIVVGADRLEVAEACNGLSMLMCLAATVSAATLLLPLASWKRAALLASILPIALLSNVLRIAATAWCYRLFGAEAGGHFAHDAAGWLMMPLALLLVGSELAVWSWLIVARPESESTPPAHGSVAIPAPLGAGPEKRTAALIDKIIM